MQIRRVILKLVALLALGLALSLGTMAATPIVAGAQEDGYDGYDGEDPADPPSDDFAAPPASDSGALPVTGGTTLLAAAVVIGGVGYSIRRLTTT